MSSVNHLKNQYEKLLSDNKSLGLDVLMNNSEMDSMQPGLARLSLAVMDDQVDLFQSKIEELSFKATMEKPKDKKRSNNQRGFGLVARFVIFASRVVVDSIIS